MAVEVPARFPEAEPVGEAVPPDVGTSVLSRLGSALERNVFTLCVLATLSFLLAQLVRSAVIDDTWYSLLSGRLIAHSGLPGHDTLTVLALGRRWVDQQWLAHLGLYGLWSAGGWGLLGAVAVVLYAGAFAVSAFGARRAGASDRSAALVFMPCFLAGLPNSGLRAQLPAYLLFALVLGLLLADARRPSRRVYLVFPLLVLWANVHGSVVLGAALVALSGLVLAVSSLRARRPRGEWAARAGVLVALPWLCTLASPYTVHLPGYYRSLLDNPTLAASVGEWGPSTLRGEPLFFVVLLPALWLASRWSRALTPFAQLALWGTAIGGLFALRNEVWFALAAAAIVPASLDAAWPPSSAARRRNLNLALGCAAIAVVAIGLGRAASFGGGSYERDFPPQAAAAVAAATGSPGARVFANERYADWLLFEDPALGGRMAYDARLELLPSKALKTIVDFRKEHGVDWQRAARGYRVLVLDRSDDRGAVAYYRGLPGTAVLYAGHGLVALRVPTSSSASGSATGAASPA